MIRGSPIVALVTQSLSRVRMSVSSLRLSMPSRESVFQVGIRPEVLKDFFVGEQPHLLSLGHDVGARHLCGLFAPSSFHSFFVSMSRTTCALPVVHGSCVHVVRESSQVMAEATPSGAGNPIREDLFRLWCAAFLWREIINTRVFPEESLFVCFFCLQPWGSRYRPECFHW